MNPPRYSDLAELRSSPPPEFSRIRLRHNSDSGMIVHTHHLLLSFQLPRLETRLLGLDPKQLLAESTLHLFQAVPIARAEAKM